VTAKVHVVTKVGGFGEGEGRGRGDKI